jgi:hypothetical protein
LTELASDVPGFRPKHAAKLRLERQFSLTSHGPAFATCTAPMIAVVSGDGFVKGCAETESHHPPPKGLPVISDPHVPAASPEAEKERAQQMSTAGWTAGLTAFFSLGALASAPTWPTAFGVAAICAMVGFVCLRILKR